METIVSLPLFALLSFIGIFCSALIWTFGTFELKKEAEKNYLIFNEKINDHKDTVSNIYINLQKIEKDVSFIRGKMSG